MNDNQRFDEHINDQFKNYHPDVPAHIWENIVNKREKRKPIGFWPTLLNGRTILLFTALLLAAGTAAYFLLNPSTAATADHTIIAGTQQAADAATKEKAGNKTAIVPSEQKANDDCSSNTATNNDNNSAAQNKNTGTTINANSVAINNNDDANNINGVKSKFASLGKSKIKIYAPGTAAEDDAIKTNNKKQPHSASSADAYDETKNVDQINAASTDRDIYLKRLLFADLQKAGTEKKATSLNKRSWVNVSLPGCPSIEKNAAGNKTYVEIYGGPDFALRSLSDTGNSTYLQKRKESTKFSSAFSAGIRYTRVFSNGMSIRTGINYSQINEKFTFTQGNLVQVTYIIDANGDTTGSYITTGTRYKTTINRFKTFDVPLLIGYEMGNGRIHTNINAGVIVNLYSWQKGEVLDASFKPVDITTGKSNSPYQFKTNMGIGFMASASVYYKLTEKAHLLAEPYFRYNLSPMSTEKMTFTQKYNAIGLRIGLRVDLR